MKRYKIDTEEQIKHEIKKHSKKEQIDKTIYRNLERGEHIRIIRRFFPQCIKVICIGARDDSEVQSFIDHGFDAVGIDVANSSRHVKKIDAHKLEGFYNEDSFDLAYCSHVLEHLYDPGKALKAIRKICSNGVFITLPIYDKKRGMDASHCTIYDIMINPDKMSLIDFKPFKPYRFLYYERRGMNFDMVFDFR